MRNIELIQLKSGEDASQMTCILHDDDISQSTSFPIDQAMSEQLSAVVEKYPNSRYRISSKFEQDDDGVYWGAVSAVHAWWMIHASFRATECFIQKMRSISEISIQPQKANANTLPGGSAKGNPPFNQALHANCETSVTGTVAGMRRYVPSLDGIRAIAVIAVILYHIRINLLPGGFLGVTLFFVLSGYLITTLLMSESSSTGKIDIRQFWLRRIRRLLPGLYVMMAVVLIYIIFFDRAQFPQWRLDALSSVFYMSNWWFIFHQVSYFNRFGTPTPFGHLWSLSIEEQFYLVWPLVIIGACALRTKRRTLAFITFVGALVSAALMAFLYAPGFDPSRVYYGTDTHAFSLLVGATLAVLLSRRHRARHLRLRGSLPFRESFFDLVGLFALLAILSSFWWMSEYSDVTYLGGMFFLSIVAAVLITVLTRQDSRLAKVLGWQPLRWIGRRSYGIYLWHYPVIVLTQPPMNTQGVGVLRAVLQITASIVLAALSWKFIEEPMIRRGIKRGIKRGSELLKPTYERKQMPRFLQLSARGTVVAAMSLVVASGGFVFPTLNDDTAMAHGGMSSNPVSGIQSVFAEARNPGGSDTSNQSLPEKATTSAYQESQMQPPAKVQTTVGGSAQSIPSSQHKPASVLGSKDQNTNSVSSAVRRSDKTQRITAVGDSVMVDIAPYLKKLYPQSVVNGKVGRQMWQASTVFHQLQAKKDIGHDVVIELGTNGPFPEQELTSLVKYLGPNRHIFLANTRVPRSWQNHVNDMIQNVVSKYSNVRLINWYAFSAGKPSYFTPDGVHLTAQGANQYASLIQQAVMQQTPH